MPERPLACQIELNGTTVRVPTRPKRGLRLAARHHRRVRRGQKVLLATQHWVWRTVLDDPIKRGLRRLVALEERRGHVASMACLRVRIGHEE
jgi:hypothetical protein